ncbi:MAG: response regulator [Desulfohalobiaceae bacterium]|nr:response regulator [Desulfohalobiaceae bacterium]
MMNTKGYNPDFSPQNKKVLIVEDEEKNLYLARFLLEIAGFEVLEARDGEEGVQKAIQKKPDLVLMDMQLPKLDGYEATRRIRNLESGLQNKEESKIQDPKSKMKRMPVVAMTAYAMKGDREKTFAAGCDGYIEKPIDTGSFVDEVRRYL